MRILGDEALEERADNGEGAHAINEVRIKVLHFGPIPFVQDLKAVAFINVRFGLVTRAVERKQGQNQDQAKAPLMETLSERGRESFHRRMVGSATLW